MTAQRLLDSEPLDNPPLDNEAVTDDAVVTELDISHLVIEDDAPVDNFQSAQQQRLLVEALCSSQALPLPFLAEANVGLFYILKGDPIVPDVLLSLGVQRAADYSERSNRTYMVWEFGKVPEVCIEIVSNKEGNELTLSAKAKRERKTQSKQQIYAQIGVPYYVIFDPLKQIQGPTEMNGAQLRVWGLIRGHYEELTPAEGINAEGASVWLEEVGVGLTLWAGEYEEAVSRLWLRWCDQAGQVIPTGAEGQAAERQRADTEQQQRVEQQQRAEQAEAQLEAERQRAEAEQQRAERLAERLRAMGIDPDEV